MKLLTESANNSRSFNGGDYATGYGIVATSNGCVVRVDRCFGSDYEGVYIHEYELPLSAEEAEKLVAANAEVFSRQCNGANVKALLAN